MKRSEARELAVRLCFAISENPVDARELLDDIFEEEHYASLAEEDALFEEDPGKQRDYIDKLVSGVGLHNAEPDDYIMRYSIGWNFDRISRTAIAVMKVAMYEILYMPDIPTRVSVNEAVELAKCYAEEDTVPFINGVLGAFVKGETTE